MVVVVGVHVAALEGLKVSIFSPESTMNAANSLSALPSTDTAPA
jgi:hypothetical protein